VHFSPLFHGFDGSTVDPRPVAMPKICEAVHGLEKLA
jgi:hypothetical protein